MFDELLVDVTTVEIGVFSAEAANGLDPTLIFISPTTLSGRVLAQPGYELTAPIVNVEQAMTNDFQRVTRNRQANQIAGTVEIVNAD